MAGLEIWNRVLEKIKVAVGIDSFKTWISKLRFINFEKNTLQLSVTSNFIKDTILSKYCDEILCAIKFYIPEITKVNITVKDEVLSQDDLAVPGSLFAKSWITKSVNSVTQKSINRELNENILLDKKFTFENFVVGQPNEFAYAVARNVAMNSNTGFNPLFLHGDVGMGKTHLMQAIAWYKRKNQSDKKVMYVSAERFMYMFLKSLRHKDGLSFKELFRDVDVLMVDDVQFIGGKESTQEEFLCTFNKLINDGRQVILSANKSPNELKGVGTTLKSRLSGGLVVDVHPSTYELRINILRQKAKKFKVPIPQCVLESLAYNIVSSVRELEGALNRLVMHATLVEKNISLEMVKEVLGNQLLAKDRTISLTSIQNIVSDAFSVNLSDILSSTRIHSVAIARQVAMYLSRVLTDYSYAEIGKNFGDRDHSTVVHAVKSIKNKMDTNYCFRTNIEKIRQSL